mgnify:CR=1 FL=1
MPTQTLDGIVLSDFLNILLGDNPNSVCPHYIVAKLSLLDPYEQHIHIEFREKAAPLVWRVAEWRTTYIKWQRDKEESHLKRTAHTVAVEVYTAVAKAISARIKLDFKQSMIIAEAAVKSRNAEAIRILTGINIAELLKADADIAAFKLKYKIK